MQHVHIKCVQGKLWCELHILVCSTKWRSRGPVRSGEACGFILCICCLCSTAQHSTHSVTRSVFWELCCTKGMRKCVVIQKWSLLIILSGPVIVCLSSFPHCSAPFSAVLGGSVCRLLSLTAQRWQDSINWPIGQAAWPVLCWTGKC